MADGGPSGRLGQGGGRMTSCHIEADIWVDGGYLNGLKRVYVEFGGDNC